MFETKEHKAKREAQLERAITVAEAIKATLGWDSGELCQPHWTIYPPGRGWVDIRVYTHRANLKGKSEFEGLEASLNLDVNPKLWAVTLKRFGEDIKRRNRVNRANEADQNAIYDRAFSALNRSIVFSRPYHKARFRNDDLKIIGQFDENGRVQTLTFGSMSVETAYELLEAYRKAEVK